MNSIFPHRIPNERVLTAEKLKCAKKKIKQNLTYGKLNKTRDLLEVQKTPLWSKENIGGYIFKIHNDLYLMSG